MLIMTRFILMQLLYNEITINIPYKEMKLTHHDNAAYTSLTFLNFLAASFAMRSLHFKCVPFPAQSGARVQFPARSGNFPICHMSRPILGVTQPPIQFPRIHNSFPRKRIGLNLTTPSIYRCISILESNVLLACSLNHTNYFPLKVVR